MSFTLAARQNIHVFDFLLFTFLLLQYFPIIVKKFFQFCH